VTMPDNWMKNIAGERLLFMKYVLYFTLRAIQKNLWLLFLSCRLNLRINLELTKCGPKGEITWM
jgi:hypothetical protein